MHIIMYIHTLYVHVYVFIHVQCIYIQCTNNKHVHGILYASSIPLFNISRFLPLKDLVWEQLHALETQHGTPNGTKPVYVETDV